MLWPDGGTHKVPETKAEQEMRMRQKATPVTESHSPLVQRSLAQRIGRSFKGYATHYELVLMFLPVLLYFLIFRYVPMYGITLAFKKFNLGLGILGSPWVGLDNFEALFRTPTFLRAVRNTIIISLQRLVFGFPMPILLALMLNEVRHLRFKKTVQTVSYLPHFLSWVILSGLFLQILSPSTGPVNHILTEWFGRETPIFFLGDNKYFRGTLIFTDVWKGMGWGSILYLATISGIDPSLYEAAVMDGASRLQRIRHITLPFLVPTISILLILNVGGILDAGFDQVFNMYNEAVYETADIIDTYVYRVGLGQMRYSQGTAVGLFKNVIGFFLVILTNKVTQRINGNGVW